MPNTEVLYSFTPDQLEQLDAISKISEEIFQTIRTHVLTTSRKGREAISRLPSQIKALELGYFEAQSVFTNLDTRLSIWRHSQSDDRKKQRVLSYMRLLNDIATDYFVKRIESEWAEKHPADILFALKSWLQQPFAPSNNLGAAIEFVIHRTEVQIELEREWVRNKTELPHIKRDPGEIDQFDPEKRGLTRQLAMLLLDELFPNLGASSNTAKGQFLAFLVGWSAKGLSNKWSDYRRGNPESIERDLAEVAEWKRKLKISE